MIEVTATLDKGDVNRFSEAMSQYAISLGKHSSTAPRRAAIMVCKSFRKATKNAKKNKQMTVYKDDSQPNKKWITYKNGAKLTQPLRRWKVDLVDRHKQITRYVYDKDARKQLRKEVGTNYFQSERRGGVRGLAKQSWGWVMHNIFNGAAPDTPWHRRKLDKDPKEATRESYSREGNCCGIARICNRLDYIVDALKGFTVQQAIDKVVRWMMYETERRQPK